MNYLLSLILLVNSLNLPKNLKPEIKSGKLVNGLEYLLMTCSNCEKIGVSLSVKVGSKQDPIPGLTHLLEHMIFYSSSSYPTENYLFTFIQIHSGIINAYTSIDHTNFFYSIPKEAAENSLKIFSASFFEAIFNSESIYREIQAVDSEHNKNKFKDTWEEFRLLQILMGENRLGGFSTGNFKTLNVDGIEKLVEEHYWKYYVGDKMKLVVYGNFSVGEMEMWVNEYFGRVRGGRRKGGLGIEVDGGNGTLGIRQKFGEGCKMDVSYLVTSEFEYVKYAPTHFLAYLLNNQGKSGIKGNFFTIQNFYADVSDDFDNFSILHLSFTLSDHYSSLEILSAISNYLSKIKEISEKDLKMAFNDYKKLLKLQFDYTQIPNPEEVASSISANMQFFPEEFYFSGFQIVQEFDYDYFLDVISQMNWFSPYVILSCEYFQGCFELFEKNVELNKHCEYYDMSFEVLEIDIPYKEYDGLEIYKENIYLSQEVNLVSVRKGYEKIESFGDFELWYRFNDEFGVPKAGISLLLRLENWDQYELDIEILLTMVNLDLEYNFNLLLLAGYSFAYQVNHNCAVLYFSGWNSEIFEFFYRVIEMLKSPNPVFYDQAVFLIIEKYSNFYYSQLYEQSIQVYEDFIYGTCNTADVKLAKLRKLDLKAFEPISFTEVYLKVLVWGNVYLPDDFQLNSKRFLGVSEIMQIHPNFSQVNKEGITITRSSEGNYCLYFTYTFGKFNINTWTSLLILQKIADDRAFRILRTQHQLGYIVFITASSMYNTNSLKIVIQGSGKDPKVAEKKIEEFWRDFEIDDNEFIVAKKFIGKDLEEPIKGLDQWQQEIWKEIYLERYLFDIKIEIQEKLKEIEIGQVNGILKAIRSMEFMVKIKFLNEVDEILVNNMEKF